MKTPLSTLSVAALGLALTCPAHAAPPTLVGEWHLDNTGADAVGGNTTTPFGGTSWVAGKVGQALHIDAQGGGAQMMNSIVSQFGTGDFTVSMWVLYDGKFTGHARHEHLVTSGWSGTTRGLDLFAERDGSGTYIVANGTGRQLIERKSAPWIAQKNTWHHVAIGRQGGTQYLCTDGSVFSSGSATVLDHTGQGPTYLGRNPAENGGRSFPGSIDEVQAYRGWVGTEGCASLYANPGSRLGVVTTSVTVPAATAMNSSAWVDTLIDVGAGTVVFSGAAGTVQAKVGTTEFGPAGGTSNCTKSSCPLPGAKAMALVGKVGTQTFVVGTGATVTVTAPGRLYLAVNDEYSVDNAGSFTVNVSR